MDKRILATSMAPEIFIDEIDGNLQVKGWERPEVFTNARPNETVIDEQEDGIRLTCEGNCELRIPKGALLQVGTVHGNAHLKYLEDQIGIGAVHGSLHLRSVGATAVENVHGDISAKGLSGDLKAVRVHGNATIRNVEGACSLEQVMGNLDVRDVDGEIKATVDGNARLRLSRIMGTAYQIQADGNIYCHVPEEINLHLRISSEGEVIKVKLPRQANTYQQEQLELTLGSGATTMELSASGVVYLFSQQADWTDSDEREGDLGESYLPEDFSLQIAQQVEAQIAMQLEAMTRQINDQMAALGEQIGKAGLSPAETERIMEQARLSSERETARAQEKMRRAQEKLERKLETVRRKEEQRAQGRPKRSWTFDWNSPPAPPSPPRPPAAPAAAPVSDEERLMILRMLEQKKISLDEAEKLLSSLEGKES
jgi:hypothetical protein